MEKEIESDIIKATQNSLGKYVKRPPLTEKLLKKPPFRFLHDIITTVLKTTSFFDGLFDEYELISDNVKDRESKIVFLNKVISVLSLTTGKALSVKSSKIVAGQEPEKTNELLQCLALALDKKLSSDEAVKKIKGTSNSLEDAQTQKKISTKSTKKNVSNPLISKSSEKLSSRKGISEKSATKNEKDKITENKIRKKENGQVKQPKVQPSKTNNLKDSVSLQSKSGTKVSLIQKSKTSSKNIENLNSNKKDLEPQPITEKFNESSSHDKEVLDENEEVIPNQDIRNESSSELNNDTNETVKLNSSYNLADGDFNLSSSTIDIKELENNTTEIDTDKNENVLKSDDISLENNQLQIKNNEIVQSNLNPGGNHANDNQISQIQQNDEPIKHLPLELTNTTPIPQNNTTITRPLSVRPSSSRPGAPRLREKLDNLVSETDNVLLGKVHIITENTGLDEEEEGSLIIVEPQESESHSANDTQNDSYLLQNEHGHLVQQILDSQKELSEGGKTEIEWQFGVQKAKEAQHQEIEQLKFNIQALSRVANPLGKLLDHIQEDVEVMRQELQQWKNIYDDVSKEISKEKALNEDSLQPLHAKLKQLEIEIGEKADKICDLKILIHKNATRIEKLLNSGNVQ